MTAAPVIYAPVTCADLLVLMGGVVEACHSHAIPHHLADLHRCQWSNDDTSSDRQMANDENSKPDIPCTNVNACVAGVCGVAELLALRISRAEESYGPFYVRHTDYIVEYLEAGKHTTVVRRFKEFAHLHKYFQNILDAEVPELPEKRYFGNLDPAFIEMRRRSLEIYLCELMQNVTVLGSDIIWDFLNAGYPTMVTIQFLVEESTIGRNLSRLYKIMVEAQRNSPHSPSTLNHILAALSHHRVLDRLIHVGSTGDNGTKVRVCLILKTLLAREECREYLLETDAFAVALSMIEGVCAANGSPTINNAEPDVNPLYLFDAAREFAFRFVDTCPRVISSYFRSHGGLQQFAALLQLELYSREIHSFVALLLWSSIHLQEVQSVLAEKDSTGMAVLAALYHSPNCNARIACGLILSKLLKANQFASEEMLQKAAAAVEQLPKCIQDMSCLRQRTAIHSLPPKAKHTSVGDACAPHKDTQPNPTEIETQSLTDIIMNAAAVHEGWVEQTEYLLNQQYDARRRMPPLPPSYLLKPAESLDFFFLYVLWRARGQELFALLLSDLDDNCLPEVTFFTLWYLIVLVSRARHTHTCTACITTDDCMTEIDGASVVVSLRDELPSDASELMPPNNAAKGDRLGPISSLLSPSSAKVISSITPEGIGGVMETAIQRRFEGEDISECSYFAHECVHATPQDVHIHTHTTLTPSLENSYLYCDLVEQADMFCSAVAAQQQKEREHKNSSVKSPASGRDGGGPHLLLQDPSLALVRSGIMTTVTSLLLHSRHQYLRNLASALLIQIPWADKVKATVHPQLKATLNMEGGHEYYTSHSDVASGANGEENASLAESVKGSVVGESLTAVTTKFSAMSTRDPNMPNMMRSAASILEPPVCVIPQQLLSQRVAMSRVLLEHIDKQISVAKSLLTSESERLTAKDNLLMSRRGDMQLDETQIINFLSALRKYQKLRERLENVPAVARQFLGQMRLRAESQSMNRQTLVLQLAEFVEELGKLDRMSSEIEVSFAEAAKKESALCELKGVAERLWQQLVESNAKLRDVQADLKATKQLSARFRMQWMEIEQSIVDAPRRRQQLAEQILQKDGNYKTVEEKLQSVKQRILDNQSEIMRLDTELRNADDAILLVRDIRHSFAECLKCDMRSTNTVDKHNSPKNLITEPKSARNENVSNDPETTVGSMRARYYSAGAERRVVPPNTESSDQFASPTRRTTLNVDNAEGDLQSHRDSDAPDSKENHQSGEKLLLRGSRSPARTVVTHIRSLYARLPLDCRTKSFSELLDRGDDDCSECVASFRDVLGEAERTLKGKREAVNCESLHRTIRHLAEKRRRYESKLKKLDNEIRQLKTQMDVHSNPEILVKKSEELQSLVRQKDVEVEKRSSELLEVHAASKEIERQLERKKGEMRHRESEFSTAREMLGHLVDNCNNSRRKLCMRMLSHEAEHRKLLTDITCAREDALYMSTNRYVLDVLLLHERKIRMQFRANIADLIRALQETDETLRQIDDRSLVETSEFCHAESYTSSSNLMFPTPIEKSSTLV